MKRNVDRGYVGFEKPFAATWNQAGVWAYAIHNGFKSYRELNQPELVAEGIRTIGMTNLKKTGGGATAIHSMIKKHAQSHVSLWREELILMNPQLIICCGTFALVKNGLGLAAERLMIHQGKQYWFVRWEREGYITIVMQFLHPACRNNRTETLGLLHSLVTKLKEIGALA